MNRYEVQLVLLIILLKFFSYFGRYTTDGAHIQFFCFDGTDSQCDI